MYCIGSTQRVGGDIIEIPDPLFKIVLLQAEVLYIYLPSELILCMCLSLGVVCLNECREVSLTTFHIADRWRREERRGPPIWIIAICSHSARGEKACLPCPHGLPDIESHGGGLVHHELGNDVRRGRKYSNEAGWPRIHTAMNPLAM